MSGFDLTKMMPIYLDEVDELIIALNDALLRLEVSPDDTQSLQEAFRYAHTIKGSSTLMGFPEVKALTHELETIFDQLRSKTRTLDPAVLEIFFRCLDGLRDYHQEVRAGGTSQVDLSGLTQSVKAHLSATSAPADPPPPIREVVPDVPRPELSPSVTIRIDFEPGLPLADIKAKLILNRLATRAVIVSTEPADAVLESSESLDSLTATLRSDASFEELKTLADVSGVVRVRLVDPTSPPDEPEPTSSVPAEGPSDPEHEAEPEPKPGTPDQPVPRMKIAETIRVDIDRLDSLMNLAGELVINKARFVQVARGLADLFRSSNANGTAAETQDRMESLEASLDGFSEDRPVSYAVIERWQAQFRGLRENFQSIQVELQKLTDGRDGVNSLTEAIDQLTRVTDGIQKGVLNTRMVPIGPLFNRFRRVVRDLSVASGKEVALEIQGEKTELDKRMIDELGDPLIHLIRNSVDHGLETPDQRLAAGKPRFGTVSLSAAHRGNSVVISVSDDGRGIDTERIRRKIVSSGLIETDEASRLSERELISYIWHPGLSTAERITDVSGRGVGMDIVKSRIEGLNGGIEVRTAPGQGSTFLVRLPLTLAIMPSLLVTIFGEAYAIPLDHVDEILEIPTRSVHKLHGMRAIETRRRVISLVRLDEVFQWRGENSPPSGTGLAEREKQTVVVVQNGETTVGLLVDELIGMQEVVLKSLEKNFRSVPGLSGASILGDGRVSLILDVDALIGMAAHPRPSLQIKS